MIVDVSAIVALLTKDDAAPQVARALAQCARPRSGAPTVVEAGIVLDVRREASLSEAWAELLSRCEVVDFTAADAAAARAAYRKSGKGSGSPASLNFADCLTCAIAQRTGEPLLFVGNGFTHTDLNPTQPGL